LNSPDSAGAPRAESRGERALIAEIRARVPPAPAWLAVGIGDDAAVVEPERGALEILTTDSLIEDIHFDRRLSAPGDIGWKALAVNLSDVAAMGATPRLALLSLGLPGAIGAAEIHAIIDGFLALAAETGVTLAGGNVSRSPGPLIVDVTVTGFARRRRVLTRAGGRAGDDIYVTGEIGAAAAGLGYWKESKDTTDSKELPGIAACVARHRRPEPRVRVGALLGRNRAASACMDLSDGLADAVCQVAEASGTGAAIDAASLPIPAAAREWFARGGEDFVAAAIAGGDDYELLFTVPRRARGRLATVARQARGVPLTRIGALTAEPTLTVLRDGRKEPLPGGFVHF
jgi:thiamine-monophosphate kinase